jgi:hypothetical protein
MSAVVLSAVAVSSAQGAKRIPGTRGPAVQVRVLAYVAEGMAASVEVDVYTPDVGGARARFVHYCPKIGAITTDRESLQKIAAAALVFTASGAA